MFRERQHFTENKACAKGLGFKHTVSSPDTK